MLSMLCMRFFAPPEFSMPVAARGRQGHDPLLLSQYRTYQNLASGRASQLEGQSEKSQAFAPRHFVFGTRPPLKPCRNGYTTAGWFISQLKNERRICI